MKVEKLPEYVTSTVVITIGLIFALYCGTLTGEGQVKIIGGLLAAAGFLAVCMGLQSRVWLLIPLTWSLGGAFTFLPVPLTVRQLGVIIAVASYLVLYALKGLRSKPDQDLVRIIIFLNLAYLASVFVRNPVGLHVFGSEMVGGRPYLNVAIAFSAFWVLERVPVVVRDLRFLPLVLLIGPVLLSIASAITYMWPSLRSVFGMVYSDFAEVDYGAQNSGSDDQVKRKIGLSAGGNAAIRTLCSYFAPLTLVLPIFPSRFVATAAAFTALLLSGFRSGLFAAFLYMAMSTYFRKRYRDLFIFTVMGVLALSLMAVGNGRLFNIPLSAQRAMSFLPGNWDYVAVRDAEYSSEWRFEMWRMVITEDKWIKNKWLGDGFGFSQRDLAIMAQEQQSAGGMAQESFMIVGAYHNGPLSTVRYVGFVGLLLFLPFIILLAWRSVQLIRRTYGTNLFPVALFVGMPAIVAPPAFLFIAGGFEENLPEALFTAGLLQLLGRAVAQNELTLSGSKTKAQPERPHWQPGVKRSLLPR